MMILFKKIWLVFFLPLCFFPPSPFFFCMTGLAYGLVVWLSDWLE